MLVLRWVDIGYISLSKYSMYFFELNYSSICFTESSDIEDTCSRPLFLGFYTDIGNSLIPFNCFCYLFSILLALFYSLLTLSSHSAGFIYKFLRLISDWFISFFSNLSVSCGLSVLLLLMIAIISLHFSSCSLLRSYSVDFYKGSL